MKPRVGSCNYVSNFNRSIEHFTLMNESEKHLCQFIFEVSVSYATLAIVDMTKNSPGDVIPFFGPGPSLWFCLEKLGIFS